MPIIDLPPALAYTLAGPADAPVIVFINGLGGAQAAFSLQFKDLSRDFRVLTYDHRGMGASAVVDAPVTMATYAADLLALLDHLGLMRVHLVGLSFGGRVAQSLCLMAPERVMGLVLRGIFLVTQRELKWFYQDGAGMLFPDAFEKAMVVGLLTDGNPIRRRFTLAPKTLAWR